MSVDRPMVQLQKAVDKCERNTFVNCSSGEKEDWLELLVTPFPECKPD